MMRTAIVVMCGLLFGACATVPTGPSVLALPGSGKSFDQFHTDDVVCRDWASREAGTNPQRMAGRNTAEGAGIGTLAGAGLGAVIGAAAGNPGLGAAVGAGAGLLTGTTIGAFRGEAEGRQVQARYDHAYTQCMYSKGNKVPR